jgi:ferritin
VVRLCVSLDRPSHVATRHQSAERNGYVAQTVLQLVLLPIIMVGQNVIQSQNEAKADTDHKTLTYLATLQDEQMQELKNQTELLIRIEELQKQKKTD